MEGLTRNRATMRWPFLSDPMGLNREVALDMAGILNSFGGLINRFIDSLTTRTQCGAALYLIAIALGCISLVPFVGCSSSRDILNEASERVNVAHVRPICLVASSTLPQSVPIIIQNRGDVPVAIDQLEIWINGERGYPTRAVDDPSFILDPNKFSLYEFSFQSAITREPSSRVSVRARGCPESGGATHELEWLFPLDRGVITKDARLIAYFKLDETRNPLSEEFDCTVNGKPVRVGAITFVENQSSKKQGCVELPLNGIPKHGERLLVRLTSPNANFVGIVTPKPHVWHGHTQYYYPLRVVETQTSPQRIGLEVYNESNSLKTRATITSVILDGSDITDRCDLPAGSLPPDRQEYEQDARQVWFAAVDWK